MLSKETDKYIYYYDKTSCSIVCKQNDQEVLLLNQYDLIEDNIKKYISFYNLSFDQSLDKIYKEHNKISSLTMCKRTELFK